MATYFLQIFFLAPSPIWHRRKTDPPLNPKKTCNLAVEYGSLDIFRSQRKREGLVLLFQQLFVNQGKNDIVHFGTWKSTV